jgi:YegS/Rv2252/BmrU family lipid kinase
VLLDLLKGRGREIRVSRTEGAGHATELARDACRRGADAVLAVGGDGTVNEVVNGIGAGPTALATFPLGTSSIFARDLGIPFLPEAAAACILAGRRRRIDVGTVNGHRFLMVVGVGWDAHVVNAFTEARTGHGGKLRYLAPIAKALLTYDFPEITVRVDGEPAGRSGRIAFVCNIRNYAAFFRIAPEAVPDDGLLDLVLIRHGGPRSYLRWGLAAWRGTLPRYREVDYVKGTTIRIESARPVPIQVDGDPGGTTPVEIELAHSPLEVLVP